MSVYYNLEIDTKATEDGKELTPCSFSNFLTKKTITNMSDYSVGVKRFKIPISDVPYFRIYVNRLHIGYIPTANKNLTPTNRVSNLDGTATQNVMLNQPVDLFGDTSISSSAYQHAHTGVQNDFYKDTLYNERRTLDTGGSVIGSHFLPVKDDFEFCEIMTRALNQSFVIGIPKFGTLDGESPFGYQTISSIETSASAITKTTDELDTNSPTVYGWKTLNQTPNRINDDGFNITDYKISITDFSPSEYCKLSDLQFRLRINYRNYEGSVLDSSFIDLGGGYFKDLDNFTAIDKHFSDWTLTKSNLGIGFLNWAPYARFSSNYVKGDATSRGFNKTGICVYPASNEDLDNMIGRNFLSKRADPSTASLIGTVALEAKICNPNVKDITSDTLYGIKTSMEISFADTSEMLKQQLGTPLNNVYYCPRFRKNTNNNKIELIALCGNIIKKVLPSSDGTKALVQKRRDTVFQSGAQVFMNDRLLNCLGFKANSFLRNDEAYELHFLKPPKNNKIHENIDYGGFLDLSKVSNGSKDDNDIAYIETGKNDIDFFDNTVATTSSALEKQLSPELRVWGEKEVSVFKRNFFYGLELTTNRLPIEGEIVGDGNAQKKILTDFVADPSQTARDYLLYQPSGNSVRYYPLNSDQPLDALDLQVNYSDINGIVRPLNIGLGYSASIKLEFRPTNMINYYN